LYCGRELRKGERVGDFCLNIAMFVELVMVCAYTMLAAEIQKRAALGILK
jgi:hypothetical protein